MSKYDQQISESIKQVTEINKKISDLVAALEELNKYSNRTYGVSTGFKPKRGIYYIENGLIRPLNNLYENSDLLTIDKIKSFELVNSEKKNEDKKLKITYANNQILIVK